MMLEDLQEGMMMMTITWKIEYGEIERFMNNIIMSYFRIYFKMFNVYFCVVNLIT